MVWTTGILSLALLLVQWFWMRRFKPSFMTVQLASSLDRLHRILDQWSPSQRSTHRRMLFLDFLALACYGSFGYLVSTAPHDAWLADAPGALQRAAPFLFPVAALADAVENVCLLSLTEGRPTRAKRLLFPFAKLATIVKLAAFIAFLMILLAYSI